MSKVRKSLLPVMLSVLLVVCFIPQAFAAEVSLSDYIEAAKVSHQHLLEWLAKVSKPYRGTTIRFITETTPPSDWTEEAAAEFTKYTGIKVIVERQAHPHLQEKALMDFSAGTGIYDVFNGDYSWTGKYVEAGYVIPLDDYLNNPNLTYFDYFPEDFYAGFWEGTSWKGHPYGLPYDSVIQYMFYNKADFENAGIVDAEGNASFPRTPDEWLADVKKLHNPPKLYGTGIQGKRHLSVVCEYLPILWAFKGQLYDSNYNVTLDSEAGLKSLKFYKELSKYAPPGATTWTWDQVCTALQQHIVAMSMLWDENYGAMEDPTQSKVVGQIRYGPVPSYTEKPISHYGGSSLFIPASSKKKIAAYLFSQWATSKPVQLLGVGKGASPTRRSIYTIPILRKMYPSFVATDKAAPVTGWRPRIPEWDDMAEIMARELNAVLAANKDPEAALKVMATEIDKILTEAGYKK
ncbi:sugar ABC transporter substrate-binding protein [Candidatus Aerophobetes bacterium]|nr:sugar ABC transporter substrate-binding protein [Candidatus Aerophobetes bacterium]